jgi:prolipoprotein diacylglyceryltransferase
MKKVRLLLRGAFIAIFLLLVNVEMSLAQCAMCKATVENAENSDTFASGLNAGILYLMSIPYILFGVIAFMWYRNSKKNKQKRDKIEQRIKGSVSGV